jgi:tetratricopeptide (TPR) repeat protein
MNSWHSWSPNSRWLVFSSKANSAYTQLCLTHIDEQGHSSPPLFLTRFSEPDRAANLPEFVNLVPDALVRIQQQFAEDLVHLRAGNEHIRSGDLKAAQREYQHALGLNPDNVQAHQRLGVLLYHIEGRVQEGMEHLTAAVRLAPRNPYIHFDLGMAWLARGQLAPAVTHLTEALQRMTNGVDDEYNPADAQYKLGMMLSARHARSRLLNPEVDVRYHLGLALFLQEAYATSASVLQPAVAREARHNADVHCLLALALAAAGQSTASLAHYTKARELKSDLGALPALYDYLGITPDNAQRFRKAIVQAESALKQVHES